MGMRASSCQSPGLPRQHRRHQGQVAEAGDFALAPYGTEGRLQISRDVQPAIRKERGDGVMRAAEDCGREGVAAAEHQGICGRIQVPSEPGRRRNLCGRFPAVVEIQGLEEPSRGRGHQVTSVALPPGRTCEVPPSAAGRVCGTATRAQSSVADSQARQAGTNRIASTELGMSQYLGGAPDHRMLKSAVGHAERQRTEPSTFHEPCGSNRHHILRG